MEQMKKESLFPEAFTPAKIPLAKSITNEEKQKDICILQTATVIPRMVKIVIGEDSNDEWHKFK